MHVKKMRLFVVKRIPFFQKIIFPNSIFLRKKKLENTRKTCECFFPRDFCINSRPYAWIRWNFTYTQMISDYYGTTLWFDIYMLFNIFYSRTRCMQNYITYSHWGLNIDEPFSIMLNITIIIFKQRVSIYAHRHVIQEITNYNYCC